MKPILTFIDLYAIFLFLREKYQILVTLPWLSGLLLGMQLELIWESVANDMTSLGIGFYELNYQYSRTLNSRLGVRYYPQFLAVFEGKVLKYNMEEYSKESFRLFVWKLIPQGLVKQVCYCVKILLLTSQ